jgi:hypothetical protein
MSSTRLDASARLVLVLLAAISADRPSSVAASPRAQASPPAAFAPPPAPVAPTLPFGDRWAPTSPPPAEGVQTVRTVQFTFPPSRGQAPPAEASSEGIPLPLERPQTTEQKVTPAPRVLRRRAGDGFCERHGLHRVDYGHTWRCRR